MVRVPGVTKCPDSFVDPRMPPKGIGTFKGFSSNSEDKNVIEFQNVVRYVLKLSRIFSLNLEKRPETRLFIGHFVIQGYIKKASAVADACGFASVRHKRISSMLKRWLWCGWAHQSSKRGDASRLAIFSIRACLAPFLSFGD